jgi:hypothetical protein
VVSIGELLANELVYSRTKFKVNIDNGAADIDKQYFRVKGAFGNQCDQSIESRFEKSRCR